MIATRRFGAAIVLLATGLGTSLWTQNAVALTGCDEHCNGNCVKWSGTASFTRNSCSVNTTNEQLVYAESFAKWLNILGMNNILSVGGSTPPSDCTIGLDDGQNDFAIVDRSVIEDEKSGYTWTFYDTCLLIVGSQEIEEADIVLANDCDYNLLAMNQEASIKCSATGGALGTAVHEVGHAHGLSHSEIWAFESWVTPADQRKMRMAFMHGTSPYSAVADIGPSLEPKEVLLGAWDAMIGRNMYSSSNTERNLAAASAYGVDINTLAITNGTEILACPGETLQLRYSVINRGTEPETFKSQLYLLSTSRPSWSVPNPFDIINWTETIGAESGKSTTRPFNVIATPAGQYRLYHQVDSLSQVTEQLEDDNVLRTRTIVKVSSCN